jgi:hypothetical protein
MPPGGRYVSLEQRIRATARAIKAWTGQSFADLGSGCGWSVPTAKRKLNAGASRTKGSTLSLDDVEQLCAHWRLTPAELMGDFADLEAAGRLPHHIKTLVQAGEHIPRAWPHMTV